MLKSLRWTEGEKRGCNLILYEGGGKESWAEVMSHIVKWIALGIEVRRSATGKLIRIVHYATFVLYIRKLVPSYGNVYLPIT